MDNQSHWKRRGFIGSMLVGGGAAMGWLVRRFQSPEMVHQHREIQFGSQFVYDVSEFESTDPALLLYEPAGGFDPGLNQVKRIASTPAREVMVAGGTSIVMFKPDGTPVRRTSLDDEIHALHVTQEGRLFVGLADRFLELSGELKELRRSPALGRKTYITSLAHHRNQMFVADAGNREIAICDLETGAVLERFGRKDASRHNPGFNVPSPYFDLAVAEDGRLRVVNPGMLRVETYTLDGRFVSSWGEPGMQIDRFCGCCNPVFFTLMDNGNFITSEKGLARINVYSPEGEFKGAVAGPDVLVDDKALAKRACNDCTIGAGFDVAVDDDGNVLALDPFRRTVRRFTPKKETKVASR